MKVPGKSPRRDKQDAKKPARPRKGVSKESNSQPDQGQRFDGERRVVLFDLDGTLMKSSEAWADCSKRALAQLTELAVTPEIAFNAYRAIYECHPSIKGRVGPRGHIFEDVRQEWNTRTSYALLLAWSELFFNLLKTPQLLELKVLKDAQKSATFFEKAEEIRDTWSIEYAPQIDSAIEAFRKGNFSQYLYPGVPDLLLKLREKGIQYNIATEGDLPTQWWKIRAIGLDKPHRKKPKDPPLVKESQLLTTSQAARPRGARQALLSLSERYRGRAAASLEASNVNPPLGPQHRSPLETSSKASQLAADGLARMAGFFTRLASKISEDASGEVQPEFYTRVLYAINQLPDDPRYQLDVLAEFSKWNAMPRIRLAMVGDKHPSDVLPVRKLVSVLGTEIMSIWVKQGKHGKQNLEHAQPKDWEECNTIAEAGRRFLLNDDIWEKRTQHIVEPVRLFFSVIEPARGSTETLDRNVHELLAGIGAVRSGKDEDLRSGARGATVDREITETVSDLLKFIVIDIRSTPRIRPKVIRVLKDLCRFDDPLDGTGVLEVCVGLPKATIELLLAIAEGKGDPTFEYKEYLGKMANLLNVHRADWAAAVIKVLSDAKNSEVVEHICSSTTMSQRYHDRLAALKNDHENLPPNFPLIEMDELFHKMGGCIAQGTPDSSTPPPQSEGSETTIGESAKQTRRQQRIYLGANPEGNQVYCFLGGPKVRNIVCVCGSPGSGKSSSVTALVLGALNGEGLEPASTPKSAVIVFHHELGGPCEFVGPAQESGVVTKVFAFEEELENIRTEYHNLQPNRVMPIRFRLDQLSNEQITRWLGLPEKGALAKGFREARATLRDKKSMKELREAIETTPSLDQKKRKPVLNALRKLEPIVAKAGESTVDDEVNPGQLIVIDCGRGGGLAARLPAWEIVVSVLEKHWDSDRTDEHTLLVFDELHQSLGQTTDSDAKQLSSRLRGLGDRLGLHQQVSIIAASQTAKDFKEGGDLWEAATVLLFHFLRAEVADVPKGSLWQRAKQHREFGDLGNGQAWYCSAGQDPDTVQVRRRA